MAEPNADDPLDSMKAQIYRDNRARYIAEAAAAKNTHASKSLAEIKAIYSIVD